jgi:nucleoside-diphosphate-sugar epimerase
MEMARANEDPARLIGPRDANLPLLEGLNLIGFPNRIDASRIRGELGWRPRYSYAQALAEMERGRKVGGARLSRSLLISRPCLPVQSKS